MSPLARRKRYLAADVMRLGVLPCLHGQGLGHKETPDFPHDHHEWWSKCRMCDSVFFRSDDKQWFYLQSADCPEAKAVDVFVREKGVVSTEPSEMDLVVEASGGIGTHANPREFYGESSRGPMMGMFTKRRSTFTVGVVPGGGATVSETVSNIQFWARVNADVRLTDALAANGYEPGRKTGYLKDVMDSVGIRDHEGYMIGYKPPNIGISPDGEDAWKITFPDGVVEPFHIELGLVEKMRARPDLAVPLTELTLDVEEYEIG